MGLLCGAIKKPNHILHQYGRITKRPRQYSCKNPEQNYESTTAKIPAKKQRTELEKVGQHCKMCTPEGAQIEGIKRCQNGVTKMETPNKEGSPQKRLPEGPRHLFQQESDLQRNVKMK